MKKIVSKLIMLFLLMIFYLKIYSFAMYCESLKNIQIRANIAEPIIKIEPLQETIFCKMNSNSENKEYIFSIKNYYINENNIKRISETDFDFNFEVTVSNKQFPIKYKLYDCNTQKEILDFNEKIHIEKDIEFENKYKLVIFWQEKTEMAKNANVEIIVKAQGKYNISSKLLAFSLSKDNIPIFYRINKSEEKYTNQNVLLSIDTNKPVKEVEGFELSQDRKKLTKIVENNESNAILLKDDYENQTIVNYTIDNIDKIPPEIIGIEEGKIYNREVNLKYRDNTGIKDIIILNKHSNNADINPYKLTEQGGYEIIVIDLAGNKTRKIISIVN